MNQHAVDVLVQAVLDGRPQEFGQFYNPATNGRCALGYLAEQMPSWKNEATLWETVSTEYGLNRAIRCPHCNTGPIPEVCLIMHLNDVHRWDLLSIARKLGPSEEVPS